MTDTITTLETGDLVIPASASICRKQENGRLNISYPGGKLEDVQLIPTFPLSQRCRMIAVLDVAGEEIALIDDAGKFDAESRRIVKHELECSYFMPKIEDVIDSEDKLGVLTIEARTDRGLRTFQIRKPRRSIRKLPNNRVVIRDVDSNRYEIRDWTKLSPYGRDVFAQYL